MEKNKGIFPFRKHPVGELPDGKKERKQKEGRLRGTNVWEMRRALGMLLAAAVLFNALPFGSVAASESSADGLCEHHPEHTAECGYAEAQPCTHEHGEECYKTVTECVHTHTDECYPETGETEESTGEGNATPSDAGNWEPSLCTHVCSEESGCITKVLDCHHEHDESCGYQEAQDCGYVCEICNGTELGGTGNNAENDTENAGTDTAECICETLCTEDSFNGDCPVCGADDASLLDCKGKVPEENTGEQEDTGICKHHQEHDADCGYIPKSEDGEGSPCTYECRICPVEDLIAALPDKVTEDNADDVRARLDEILDLYRELDEDEQGQIDLSRIYALQGALDAANAPMTAEGRTEQQDTDEASVTINGETLYYATLGEAFAAANGKTATITMLTDAECVHSGSNGAPLNINSGTVTLNLNGKTLSGKGYGDYGIINVSGGSLLVQGEDGEVRVARRGLSCRGTGKLIVEDITLELIGDNIALASAGVDNEGGTIILNGTQMTGEASNGQIYQYSGTTTINNVTATGTTDSCPESVMYYSEGTLTINGGAFDKIAVDSGNYGGVQSVAELLGEGCAYKKQDGTWATDDELAGLEISNITVVKIPLTINPNGDTSWYYSTQQTHTLAMNAAPVNGSDSVAYVWKNGNEALDCTSDTYTVSADTPVGSYTYTCEATCDGYTLSHTFTFKIEQSGTEFTGGIKTYNGSEETTSFSADDTITVKAAPTATGTAPQKAAARLRADPAAGQMALFVGDVQVSELVSAGEGGTYTMTVSAAKVLLQGNTEPNGNAITLTAKFVGNDNMADGAGTVDVNITAVAKAEKDNAVIGYYGESNLDDAFADSSNADATFTLLSDVELSTYLTIQIDCTLDLGGHTITGPMGRSQCVIVETNTAVTIRGEGEITAPYGIALAVNGSVTLEGGTYTSGGSESSSVRVVGQSAMLSVTGEKVSIRNTSGGYGLIVAQAQSVRLSAGTYSGTAGAISSTVKLSDMLAHTDNIRYAYYQSDALVTTGLDGQALTGTVTVKVCDHTGDGVCEYTPNENDASTHTKTCLACGYAETGNCGFEKTADPTADNHTGQCPYCKRDRSDAHSFSEWSGDPVARACTVCGYEQTAVAKVEKSNGGGTEYMTAKGLNTVFASNSDYEGATVTLLDDVMITEAADRPRINIRCTLNLNGHTIRSDAVGAPPLEVSGYGNVTITGNGKVVSNSNIALLVLGTVVLEGGTFSSGVAYSGTVEVMSGNLSVTGENVVMENTGSGNGLLIYNLEAVRLSAGKYSGAAGAISVSADAFTLSSLLNQEGISRVAYYKDNATLVTEGLDGQTLPSGSYTVKACTHAYQYTHTTGTTTHSQTCPACGDAKAAETCSYNAATGRCACGSTLAVTLPADLALTYDGTAKTPAVTVTVDGAPLTEGYSVAYNNNINAGNAAAVTITGTSFTGTATLTFSIGKATPTIAWSSTSQELTYTGQQAVITAPTVTLENNENFKGTISYSYKKQGETAYKDGLPTDAGTYTIKAHVDAEGNYNAADSINELTLTIKKADAEITVGTAAYDVKYGDSAFTINGVTDTNPETAVQYAVTEGTDVISVSNGTVTIKNAGTATITVSLPETANYNAAANKTITVTVAKKGGYTECEINKKYYYDRENTAEINLASLLPRDCGTVTYGEPVITSGNMTFTAKAVENGVLSYTLAKGNVNDAGTITVTVTTRNYEDITVTVKAVLTDQIPVELKEGTEVTLANTILTYGESLSGLGFNNAVFVDGDGKTVEGILAWKDAAAKPSAGTTSAVWVFTPTDNAYALVEGTVAITVNKAVPTVSAAPTVADRIYNPSATLKGDDLSVSGVAVTGVNGSTLEGTWGWQSADIVPTVDNSGYEAVFTPKDATNYETVSRTVTVTIEKAMPYIAVLPTAAGITYGEALKDSALSGGTAQYGNGAGQAGDGAGNTAAVTGTFTWKESSTKPVVADSNVTEYTVVFTPFDTANYNPVEAKVTLTVNKAQNAPNMPGSTMDVSNSLEKVGDVSLPEGWEWQVSDHDTALEVGKPVSAVAVYAGADKGSYENETVTVAITRSACDHVAGEILYTGAGEKAPACTEDGLGHRECTKCGSVVESGIVVKAPGHTGGTATCSKRAVCTRCGQPYGDTDGSVHGDTEIRGFVAVACTAGGYTGDTYCKDCGAKTKTGNVTPALGHDYTSTVTKEPATGSEGTRTYTCTRCGHSYTESIPKLPEETQGPSQTGGSGSDSSVSDSAGGSTGAAPGQPFLKDSSGREGWAVVRAEAEKAAAAQAGGTVAVDMNGAVSVPGSIFEAVRGKDVTLSFDMGGGITWSVNGKDVTAETAGSTDFSVKMGAGAIPAGLVEETASGLAHMELSLAHEGAFGFTATLTVRIISSGGGITAGSSGTAAGYTGMYANLFYYNPAQNSLEFICAGRVGEDGTVDLPFVHASDYTLILSASPMGDTQEPAAQARVKSVKLSKTLYTYDGKAKKPSVVAVDTEGRRISGKYYTVSYQNNKKVGKAAVTIKFKGGYSGTVKKTFTIRPAGTSIQKLASSSGGFTVKWKKKTAQTSGYQIQYSANAKFKGSSTRSVLVKNNSQVQKTVKNLKAQTKYYVRIRTYKTVKVNGKNTRIYSAWSKAVTVKTLPTAPGNKTAASVRGAEFLIVEKEDGKR